MRCYQKAVLDSLLQVSSHGGTDETKEIVSMAKFGYLSPLPFPLLYLSINFSKMTFKGMYGFNYFVTVKILCSFHTNIHFYWYDRSDLF